jgi:hypothetical protein
MRRTTNGVKSQKGFPKQRERVAPQSNWADLAKKAGLELTEDEAQAQLKNKPVTIYLRTKNEEFKKQFAARDMKVWECKGGWVSFEPHHGEGVLFLGDIESIKLDQ